MPPSDSDNDDLEFELRTSEVEADDDNQDDIEDEIFAASPQADAADDVTDADEDSPSEDSEEEDEDEDEDSYLPSPHHAPMGVRQESTDAVTTLPPEAQSQKPEQSLSQRTSPSPVASSPKTRQRSPSPAEVRKRILLHPLGAGPLMPPRSYTVEAICAIPHPAPTHSLASSFCMTHLITGSDDGYIRDYDVFSSVNGKITLTAPQRHHCNVVEGNMKAGQLRYWWENPDATSRHPPFPSADESSLSPVYSLSMHSDALWALAGTKRGHVNLFTVRHEPGRLAHVLSGAHRGAISALALDHHEKGFFSAGWDGDATQWDLNTGQVVRKLTSHGAQLVAIAVRPLNSHYAPQSPASFTDSTSDGRLRHTFRSDSHAMSDAHKEQSASAGISLEGAQLPVEETQIPQGNQNSALANQNLVSSPRNQDSDTKSDASFDPLFDDEMDADGEPDHDLSTVDATGHAPGQSAPTANSVHSKLAVPESTQGHDVNSAPAGRNTQPSVALPKNAPPLLDSSTSTLFSPDILMIAAIDGQVMLWDKRINSPGKGVGRLWLSEKTPPWCLSACWSADGGQIYAGRRNGTVDVWDVRLLGHSGPNSTPRLLKSLRNPVSSGVVSCVVPFPDGRHIACASTDNIRLWNAADSGEADGSARSRGGVQFKIIPGHHGGYVSQMLVDPCGRFLVSASSNRGWHGESTRTVFVHDIKAVM